jgi:ATP-dependent Lon protease
MPAHINYETTPIIFYKFVCENPEIKSCYVGHTTNFRIRRGHHKHACNTAHRKEYNNKIYQTIREHGGFENWKMVEIDRQICLDLSDARKIEQKYIEELQANMNMIYAFRTDKQYEIDNKVKIAEQKKIYNLENKEKIRKIKKKYEDEHKTQISERKKQYYLNRKGNQCICECGGSYHQYKNDTDRHLQTKIHKDYLATINNVDNI